MYRKLQTIIRPDHIFDIQHIPFSLLEIDDRVGVETAVSSTGNSTDSGGVEMSTS